jgi:hypothetical protein
MGVAASTMLMPSAILGTTNSAVAVMEGKTPKIIENSEGNYQLF